MLFDNHIARKKKKAGRGCLSGLERLALFCYATPRGHVLRKEVAPMWQFLTDVAAQIVASIVAAFILRRLMK